MQSVVIVGLETVFGAVFGAVIVKVVGKDELLETTFQVKETIWTKARHWAGNHSFHSLLGIEFCFLSTRASWVETSQVFGREAGERA